MPFTVQRGNVSVRLVRFFKTSLLIILLMPKPKQVSTALPSVEVRKYKNVDFLNRRRPQGPLKTEKHEGDDALAALDMRVCVCVCQCSVSSND